MNETAGSLSGITDYNSSKSFNAVKYKDNYVYTQIRRFVVIRSKREFCFACPIFTYSGRGTTKRGTRPSEHAIAYSWGTTPEMLPGEGGITKQSIPIVMAEGEPTIDKASRIYFGIHHPIQYNVKVKEVGYVPPNFVPTLIGHWKDEHETDTEQHATVTATAEISEVVEVMKTDPDTVGKGGEDSEGQYIISAQYGASSKSAPTFDNQDQPSAVIHNTAETQLEVANNPRNFFKKGRVFQTLWSEPKGNSIDAFKEMARFAVIKPGPTFSVCLRISTYSGQATTKAGISVRDHVAVIPLGKDFIPHHKGEHMDKAPIEVKIENPDVTIDPMARIHCAAPYTVGHNVKMLNIGRVFGDSVGRLEKYFAESMGLGTSTFSQTSMQNSEDGANTIFRPSAS